MADGWEAAGTTTTDEQLVHLARLPANSDLAVIGDRQLGQAKRIVSAPEPLVGGLAGGLAAAGGDAGTTITAEQVVHWARLPANWSLAVIVAWHFGQEKRIAIRNCSRPAG